MTAWSSSTALETFPTSATQGSRCGGALHGEWDHGDYDTAHTQGAVFTLGPWHSCLLPSPPAPTQGAGRDTAACLGGAAGWRTVPEICAERPSSATGSNTVVSVTWKGFGLKASYLRLATRSFDRRHASAQSRWLRGLLQLEKHTGQAALGDKESSNRCSTPQVASSARRESGRSQMLLLGLPGAARTHITGIGSCGGSGEARTQHQS